jgi:hypothetical protein
LKPRIEMSEELRLAALKPLERMLEMTPGARPAGRTVAGAA